MTRVLAVDLGGTNVRCAIVSSHGGAMTHLTRQVLGDEDATRTPDAILSAIVAVVEETLALLAAEGGAGDAAPIAAIAVGQPGLVNERDGSFSMLAAFPHWRDAEVPVAQHLRDAVITQDRYAAVFTSAATVCVYDDAQSGLAAEVFFGAGRLARTVAAITVGTGVGSAVSFDQGAYFHQGARGLIELGHAIVDYGPDARECSCGQRGCLEVYASGAAIARAKAKAPGEDDAAVYDAAAKALAVGALNAVRAYDPDVVVFCGSLALRLLPAVRAHFRAMQWTIRDDAALVPFSAAMCPEPGVQGAAALAFRELERQSSAKGSAKERFALRHATVDDKEDLYRVCLLTGDSGNDGTALFSDPQLLGEVFVGPYLTHSRTFAFALTDSSDNGRAVGYVLGALDTLSFFDLCDDLWFPTLRRRYASNKRHWASLRPNEHELITEHINNREQSCGVYRNMPGLLDDYPSHMHIDLVPEAQGQGAGTTLVCRLLDALRGAGSRGVHLTQSAVNDRAFAFYTKLGFVKVGEAADGADWILAKKLL
jgi:predicted NBD/HSP70 family sugar kinase/ribosomal protein S18 acetylase RimI-like enzyme